MMMTVMMAMVLMELMQLIIPIFINFSPRTSKQNLSANLNNGAGLQYLGPYACLFL